MTNYKFFRLFLIMSVFLMSSTMVQAIVPVTKHKRVLVNDKYFLEKYQDSLMLYKMKYESGSQNQGENDVQKAEPQYYQLFAPMTFYYGIAHDAFDLNVTKSLANGSLSAALLNVYLKRPDLVVYSQSQLEAAGAGASVVNEETKADVNDPIIELTHEAPTEADPDPVDVVVNKPNFWTFKCDSYLQFLQNYVSGNWYKGGESNYSMLSSVTLEANYDNKRKWKWDNKLELKLGFQTSRSDTVNKFKANEDLIRLTSKVGLEATKKWYYTLQFIGTTQFSRGLKANDRRTYSDFLSPLNLSLSLGMDYKVEWLNKALTGTINLSPLAVNYRYVDRTIFINNTNVSWFPTRHGLKDGKHSKLDLGSQFTVDVTWKIADNIKWKSRMYGFTSFKRVEYEWENTFSFSFNKYISSNIFIYPRFDDDRIRDDHHGYWMFKEYCSIGFNYSF